MGNSRRRVLIGIAVVGLFIVVPALAAVVSEPHDQEYVPAFSDDMPRGSVTYGH